MTEDEAKTKWCPHVIASHTNPRQKPGEDDWLHACIGSACMAWRWSRVTSADPVSNAYAGAIDDGFCGLAGKP